MKFSKVIPRIGERVEFASRYIPKCKKLLDIGCGDGILYYFISGRVKEIYGLDNDTNALKISEKKYNEIKYFNLNDQFFPYSDKTFDCVTCLDVVEHILDPNLLIRNISKVLTNNGVLIISTPNIRFTDHLIKLIFNGSFPKTSVDKSQYDGGHIHFFTYKDLRSLLEKNNLKVIGEEGIINKEKRGWKGQLVEFFLGRKIMNEFRSSGILLIAQKI